MNLFGYLVHSLRYFVVMGITIGLAIILFANGANGLLPVLKLIVSGIVMNGAVWLLARWVIRRLWPQQENLSETKEAA